MSTPTPSTLSGQYAQKQAKALLRAFRRGEANALARAGILPRLTTTPISLRHEARFSLRDAQHVIAREHGFPSWKALSEHIHTQQPVALREAFRTAQRAIQQHDADALRTLLRQHPPLVHEIHPDHGRLIEITQSYANDAGENPDFWNAVGCAEVLLEAGSVLTQDAWIRALTTASFTMVEMLARRGALPINLRTLAALGDTARLPSCFSTSGVLNAQGRPQASLLQAHPEYWPSDTGDIALIHDAVRFAARFQRVEATKMLLSHLLKADAGFQQHLSAWGTTEAFTELLLAQRAEPDPGDDQPVWLTAQIQQLYAAIHKNQPTSFEAILRLIPEILEQKHHAVQIRLLEDCAVWGRSEIARNLLNAGPSLCHPPRLPGDALRYAIDYGHRDMIEILLELWEPQADLPTLAGLGRLEAVRHCFDENGALKSSAEEALVYPDVKKRRDPAKTLVHALGLAVMNEQLEVAQFLLTRGADINAQWGLHEPATILHEAAGHGRINAVRFLIEQGADPTLRDQRFQATACQWAEHMGQTDVSDWLRGLT